jgi:formylmethanofuran dehydrogenase subunit E
MPLATEQGKKYALERLAERRTANAQKPVVDNASLPAGAPMYYRCKTCGETIVVPENWITRRILCVECDALKDLGWLE